MSKLKFNIKDYPGKYAMHCETEVKAALFCGYMDSVGRAWFDGTSYAEDVAYDYAKNDTAYTLDDMSRGHWQGLERCGYTILEFDDFDWIPGINPSEPQLAKADAGKPRLSLVSPYLIEAVGTVRTYGTEKYGSPDNWREVEPERYRDALMRHWCEYLKNPESRDTESGLLHIDHVACNVNFLVEVAHAED